jgi:hypothetical protein
MATYYFDDPADAKQACEELAGLGIPESAIDLEICDDAATFLTRVKEFFGVEPPEELRGAMLTIPDDSSQRSLIEDTLARYNVRNAPARSITGEIDIPTVRSSTGVPIKQLSER